MMVGIDQAGIAQHMAGVESLIGGNIQRRTDGFDEAVLTVQIDVGQQTVVIITGDQLGNMFDQKGRHTVSPFTFEMKKSGPIMAHSFWQIQRSSRK